MAVVTAMSMFIVSCQMGEDETADGDIDYTDYGSSAAIFVRNNTNQKLVAFKGSLDERYMMGGIPANAQNHGLKNEPAIFTTTGDFPMVLITEEQYKENRSDLSKLEFTPFTKVFVFFNKAGENNVRYEISDRLGGEFVLRITNPSNLNVELRVGGVNGPTLGYAPAGMQTTTLNVGHGDMDIFPVFKRYNSQRDIIETIFPKTASGGNAWFQPIVFDIGTGPQMINIIEALQGISARTSGVASLVISNSTTGAIRLLQGTTMQYTTTGVSYWNSGTQREFQINMPSSASTVAGSEDTFAASTVISNYRIGPSGAEVNLEDVEGRTTLTLKADYMYTVSVTGSHNAGTLKAVVELREGHTGGPEPLKFDGFAVRQ